MLLYDYFCSHTTYYTINSLLRRNIAILIFAKTWKEQDSVVCLKVNSGRRLAHSWHGILNASMQLLTSTLWCAMAVYRRCKLWGVVFIECILHIVLLRQNNFREQLDYLQHNTVKCVFISSLVCLLLLSYYVQCIF